MWTPDDPRFIFVQVDEMEAEAERRFPDGQVPKEGARNAI